MPIPEKIKNILTKRIVESLNEKGLLPKQYQEKEVQSIIDQINNNAPIKIIYKNKDENEIILMFNEIAREIKKIELKKKIDSLEDEVSLNLDENLYTELLSLRNQLKRG